MGYFYFQKHENLQEETFGSEEKDVCVCVWLVAWVSDVIDWAHIYIY